MAEIASFELKRFERLLLLFSITFLLILTGE
jgi:hypothetical protein